MDSRRNRDALPICVLILLPLLSGGCAEPWDWLASINYADSADTLGAQPLVTSTAPTPFRLIRADEPNDTFELAAQRSLGVPDTFALEGWIDVGGDIDVIDLGPLFTGDMVVVDLIRDATTIRPTVALFDDRECVVIVAYDPEGTLNIPGLIQVAIRHDSARYFLAVAHVSNIDLEAAPGVNDVGTGGYRFNVTIHRGSARALAQPRRQVVLLDFDGTYLTEPLAGKSVIDAFDAAAIDAAYAGLDDDIKASILAMLAENFADLDITFVSSDEIHGEPAEPFTRITFGSTHADFLGWSTWLDQYNTDRADMAVVFTGSFSADTLGFTPSIDSLGTAIANVASHELGHLLGLYHVRDSTALMDETAPARALIREQAFKPAPLAFEVFPIGLQDARMILEETVGTREP